MAKKDAEPNETTLAEFKKQIDGKKRRKTMAKKKKAPTSAVEGSYPKRKSVDIEEASNGYAVSGYDGQGNKQLHVAKSKTEAHRHAKRLLGLDKGVEAEIRKAREKARA